MKFEDDIIYFKFIFKIFSNFISKSLNISKYFKIYFRKNFLYRKFFKTSYSNGNVMLKLTIFILRVLMWNENMTSFIIYILIDVT